MTESDYKNKTDEELIQLLRQGETGVEEFLLNKYKSLVKAQVHRLYLQGGDSDDLMQEGMIGLFQAIRDFQPDAGSFSSFAWLCVRRHLFSAIERAGRKKHAPLNFYSSLSEEQNEEVLTVGPEEIVVSREYSRMLEQKLRENLSSMEKSVLDGYLEGFGYREIAEQMKLSPKTVDNAIQRIRSKAQKLTGAAEDPQHI